MCQVLFPFNCLRVKTITVVTEVRHQSLWSGSSPQTCLFWPTWLYIHLSVSCNVQKLGDFTEQSSFPAFYFKFTKCDNSGSSSLPSGTVCVSRGAAPGWPSLCWSPSWPTPFTRAHFLAPEALDLIKPLRACGRFLRNIIPSEKWTFPSHPVTQATRCWASALWFKGKNPKEKVLCVVYLKITPLKIILTWCFCWVKEQSFCPLTVFVVAFYSGYYQ